MSEQHAKWAMKARSRGLSLVELLIAVTLAMILTAGVIQIFVSSGAAYDTTRGLSYLQENGRFAMAFMARDARQSGFSLCTAAAKNNINNLVNTGFVSNTRFERFLNIAAPVHGWEYSGTSPGDGAFSLAANPSPSAATGNWQNDGGNALDGIFSGHVVPGSDVVVFKRVNTALGADNAVPGPTNTSDVPRTATTTALDEASGIRSGEFVLLNDCKGADIFVNTAGAGSTSVSRSTGGELSHEYAQDEMRVARVRPVAFYVGQGSSGEPALFRWEIDRDTDGVLVDGNDHQELLEGVESLQVLYGEDTDGDLPISVDRYVPANQVNDWWNVVSVRFALLMRTVDDGDGAETDTQTYRVGATGDPGTAANVILLDPADIRRFRDVYQTTVALRNTLADFE